MAKLQLPEKSGRRRRNGPMSYTCSTSAQRLTLSRSPFKRIKRVNGGDTILKWQISDFVKDENFLKIEIFYGKMLCVKDL